MLIVGGAGNNRGAILGAFAVCAVWTLAGAAIRRATPPEMQPRAAALQVVVIGVALAAVLVWRPRGLIGEAQPRG